MKLLKKYIFKFKFIITTTIVALTIVVFGSLLIHLSFPSLPTQFTAVHSPKKLNSPVPAASTSPNNSDSSRMAYGHHFYAQADSNLMMTVASYATGEYHRFESLAPEAGKALMKMIYAARDEQVWIIPISGFRTIEQQQKLFQEQIKRRNSVEAAAKLSAPPGYSEHHTGFAIDLADGNFPKLDITSQFENTQAYLWLTHHAKQFGFELSFPLNNSQGVNYEPWHWRYVSSPKAASVFAKAKNLQ
jgi:D-alanyl-D-alanine carboxypeptidase